MRLDLAGLRVRVEVTGPMSERSFHARFGQYEAPADGRADDVSLEVRIEPRWAPPQPVRNRYPGIDFSRDADGAMRFLRLDGETVVQADLRRASAVVLPTLLTADPLEDITPIDTPLRLLLARQLPSYGGAMLHACGFADERGAVVFVARSGGGKTTTARKLPADHVLSDDLVALRRTDAGWDACSLPFVGEWQRPTVPRRAPLRALVFLRKADDLSVARCSPAVAFPELLQSMVWFAKGDPGAVALLDAAQALTRAVPCFTLALARDEPVRPLLERWLA